MQEKPLLSPIQVLNATADTILEKSVNIDIDVLNPRWWECILIKLRVLPPKRSFSIRPATLGNMIRISKILLDIDINGYKERESAIEANYHVYEKHGIKLAQIVAIAITNSEHQPDSRLVNFIKENITASELTGLVSVVIKQLDVVNFMSTIISIKGRMSLLNPEENIAFGQPSEV